MTARWWGAVTFGQTPIAPGHRPSALFEADAETFGRLEISRSILLRGEYDDGFTVVATLRVRNASNAVNWRTLLVENTGNAATTRLPGRRRQQRPTAFRAARQRDRQRHPTHGVQSG